MIKTNNIQWLFFDLGHTLINEDFSQQKRNENAVNYLNSVGVNVTYDEFYNSVCRASKDFKSPFVTAFNSYINNDYFIEYPAEYEVLFNDTNFVLKQLAGRYNLAVIANQFNGTNERLKNFGIYNFFRFIFASSDVGLSKPNPLIFIKALERAECQPENAVMIGDRLDNDIKPAMELKMKTIWVKQGYGGMQNPSKLNCYPDATVNSLTEILNIL